MRLATSDGRRRPKAADNPNRIDYDTRISQSISKIITGASPVSSWDQTLDGWYKAGGEEYVRQMNEQIKKQQGA